MLVSKAPLLHGNAHKAYDRGDALGGRKALEYFGGGDNQVYGGASSLDGECAVHIVDELLGVDFAFAHDPSQIFE